MKQKHEKGVGKIVKGITNQGNECYMNSGIQLLLSSTVFVSSCFNMVEEYKLRVQRILIERDLAVARIRKNKEEKQLRKDKDLEGEVNDSKETIEQRKNVGEKKEDGIGETHEVLIEVKNEIVEEKKEENVETKKELVVQEKIDYSVLTFFRFLENYFDEDGGDVVSKSNFFKFFIKKYEAIFDFYGQEDCHEFLVHFLDSFHEEFKGKLKKKQWVEKIKQMAEKSFERKEIIEYLEREECMKSLNDNIITSQIYDCFGIYSVSTVTCNECKNVNRTVEYYNTFLSLPVVFDERRGKGKKFKEKKDSFLSKWNVWGNIKNYYNYCRTSCLGCCAVLLPFEYNIELFGYGCTIDLDFLLRDYFSESQNDSGDAFYRCDVCKKNTVASKKEELLKAPQVLLLHVRRFNCAGFRSKISNKLKFETKIDLAQYFVSSVNFNKKQYVYELSGVVEHQGTISYGHYMSYVRKGKKWFLCNDRSVKEVTEQKVKNLQAYILLFERVAVK